MHDKSNIYPELKILSPLEQTWASYRRNPLAMGGLWCFGLLLLVTLIGPLVIPYGIDDQHSSHLLLAPSWANSGNIDYFLGTDDHSVPKKPVTGWEPSTLMAVATT